MISRALGGFTVAALLAGCAAVPPASPPSPTGGLTAADHFHAAPADAPAPTAEDLRWWRRFGDPALNDWVERSLTANLDLALARAQADEARALLRAATGERGPTLNAEARIDTASRAAAGRRRTEPALALAAAWDADLWGALQAAERSAAATLLQREHRVQAARLSAAGLTARAYVAWRAAQIEARQLDDELALQREVARVVQVRVDAGLAPRLDAQRARSELAAGEAALLAAAARVRDAERALQLLAGDRPGAPLPAAASPPRLPQLDGRAPLVRPLDLLRGRPDLRAAEAGWRAALAELDASEAARRPSLRLAGTLTLGSAVGGDLLARVTAAAAASLIAPLVDGGRRDAERDAAAARVQAAALVWQQTLQQALAQVEAAWQATADSAARIDAQQRAVDEAEAAIAQARTLYGAGLVGLLDVLDAQRTALARRQTLLQWQADAALAAIASFEALGLIAGEDPPA